MTDTRLTIEPQAGAASVRPWGAWTSIAWAMAATASQLLLLLWIIRSPSLRHSMGPVPHFLLWAISPVVLVTAVLARRLSVAPYFAWTVPRPKDVLIAVGAALLLFFGIGAVTYVLSGGTSIGVDADAYRHYLAAGGAPSGYLLKSYQAYIYAPFVEETVFRGFLWRGLAASRLGNWGAWLLTSVLFTASHTIDYANPGTLVSVAVGGLIFGLVRWRTGSSTASMITHLLSNLSVDAGAMLAVAVGWP
jgi:uncharacterized protein